MLYMKEDDMDEMMRKAAEHYEVDADKASDWNAVYNAVHNAEATVPVEKKKQKRRFIFWWFFAAFLFLFPLLSSAFQTFSKNIRSFSKRLQRCEFLFSFTKYF